MISKNCIIIDDDQAAVDRLTAYISHIPMLNLIESYTDPLLALHLLSMTEPVDLILLDIHMPGINGIELAEIIRSRTDKLLFTTGHTKHAYDAFRVDGNGYLLKPFSLAQFIATINKLFSQSPNVGQDPEKQDHFLVKSKADNLRLVNIRFEDIVAVESKLNYVLVHTKDRNITTHITLKEIAKILLSRANFFQFHRSYIINETHIDSLDSNTIYLTNALKIKVGETFRVDFLNYVSRTSINFSKRPK